MEMLARKKSPGGERAVRRDRGLEVNPGGCGSKVKVKLKLICLSIGRAAGCSAK